MGSYPWWSRRLLALKSLLAEQALTPTYRALALMNSQLVAIHSAQCPPVIHSAPTAIPTRRIPQIIHLRQMRQVFTVMRMNDPLVTIGIFFSSICLIALALHVPGKKVTWVKQDAPTVKTRIQVKGKRYDQ